MKYRSHYWDAAERIERYGWIQRSFGDYKRGFCILGAVADYPFSLLAEISVECGNSAEVINDDLFTNETEAIIFLSLVACIDEDEHDARTN